MDIQKISKVDSKTNLNIDYYDSIFTSDECIELYNRLEEEIKYLPKSETQVIMFNKPINITREQNAYGDQNGPGSNYKFSGKILKSSNWVPVLLEIKNKIESILNNKYKFNFCLVNKYKNGYDQIGEHRDDETQLDKNVPIVGVSFGAIRPMVFKHINTKFNKDKPGITPIDNIEIELNNGSLICINPPTNKYWYHSIPRDLNIQEPRISITFRQMIS